MARVEHSSRGFERERYDTRRDSRIERTGTGTHTRDTSVDRRDR
jgi:hypothetical protein